MSAPWQTEPHTEMLPVYFTPPLLNPANSGSLVNATTWITDEDGTPRWLAEGIQFLSAVTGNFSGDLSSGTWSGRFCSEPGGSLPDLPDRDETDIKTGVRPDDGEPWLPGVYWAFDSCDLTAPSQAEVRQRAAQVLRMRWPWLAARDFIARAADDAGLPVPAVDLVEAVGVVESTLADANVLGVVHVSPKLLPELASSQLVSRSGAGWKLPGGHSLVVDGGYTALLGDTALLSTSAPIFGWRTETAVREHVDYAANEFLAIAELSSLIAVEQVIGAAIVLEPGPPEP